MLKRAWIIAGAAALLAGCGEKAREAQADRAEEAATDKSAAITAIPTEAPPPAQTTTNTAP